jgi:UPF0755 protein
VKKLGIAALVIAILGTAGLVVGYRVVFGGSENGDPVEVAIQPGWNAERIAGELERVRVVRSASVFRVFMRIRGVGADLKAGEYRLRRSMPYTELVAALEDGPEVRFARLVIPEGLTLQQTAERVGKATHISEKDFLKEATPATVRPEILPRNLRSLEGFLYPDTYFVTEKESAADLVRRLVEEFEARTADLDWQRAKSGLDPYEVLIVASMIEEEAKADDERVKISAVIHNRLEKDMKLEIDATVQYAVGDYSGEPLAQSQIDFDSPYNTRLYAGLPPGPVDSPRVSSIEAALEPADTDDLFYVLTPDCRHHFFTSDYDEFLEAKARLPRC